MRRKTLKGDSHESHTSWFPGDGRCRHGHRCRGRRRCIVRDLAQVNRRSLRRFGAGKNRIYVPPVALRWKLRELVRHYSNYVRYPIQMMVEKSRELPKPEDAGEDYTPQYEQYQELETLNSMTPIWKKRYYGRNSYQTRL